MSPGHPAGQVDFLLHSYRLRIRKDRRWRYLGRAAFLIALAWVLAALAAYRGLSLPFAIPLCLALTVALPLAALAIEEFRRPSLGYVARLLDRRLDDRQRLVTSAELIASEERPPIADVQLASSAHILGSADPAQLYPVASPWPAFLLSVGLLLLAFGLLQLKDAGYGYPQIQAGAFPLAKQDPAAIATPTPSGLPNPDRQAGSSAQNDPSQYKSGGQQQAASQAAQDGLQNLAKALDQQSVTQQAADSIRQGNYDDAANRLADVGKQNDQLSDAAKQGLSNALSQAAGDPSTPSTLQQAEQQAAQALQGGDYQATSDAMQNLGDALKQTASNIIPQQELAKQFPANGQQNGQGQQSQGNQGQQSQGQQGQQGQNGSQGDTGQQGQQGQAQSGQQQQAGGGDQAGKGQQGQQGQGNQGGGSSTDKGQTNGQGQSGGEGKDASRVSGPSQDPQLNTAGNPFQLQPGQAVGASQPGNPDQQPGLSLQGSAASGQATSPGDGAAVNAQGESNNLQVDQWGVVQRYFGGVGK